MDKKPVVYYYISTIGVELIIRSNKITFRDKSYLEAEEAIVIRGEPSLFKEGQMALGRYANVAINFNFMSELEDGNYLVQAVKEFEMQMRLNTQVVGEA